MSGPVVSLSVEIAATPERVWEALTDPAQTPLYFYGCSVSSDWRIGSPVNYLAEDGSLMLGGTLLVCDAPHRLMTTFVAAFDEATAADRPSRVSYTIEPAGAGSRLSLLHDDFDGETATYQGVVGGWEYIVAGLKSVIETGTPLPQPVEA